MAVAEGRGSNRQTNVKPRQTTSKSSGGRCFALLLRAVSCLGCSLLSQPLSCTSVPLCSLLPALYCLAIPASSSSLAGETSAKRGGGRCFVVLLRAFCSFSIVSRLYLCVPLLPTLCSLTIPTSSLSVRSRQRAMAMAVVATVLLCLCERSSLSITSLLYLCLSVESVPYPHSVLSPFRNPSSLCDTTAKNCGGRCRFVVLCEHCPPLFTQASFGIAPRLYVPLALSLCASHCVALVRASVSL